MLNGTKNPGPGRGFFNQDTSVKRHPLMRHGLLFPE